MNSLLLFNIRDDPRLTREVIRSRYISTTEPDMTHVTVRLDTQPRVGATYTCTVTVEGRSHNFVKGVHTPAAVACFSMYQSHIHNREK